MKLLPPLASYEFEELKASIAEHGVLQHILVLPDGRIIDGCHRWKIAGDKTPYDILNLDEQSAFLLGLAMNIARRQMSPDQKNELRKKQRPIAIKLRETGMSQSKVAGILGVPEGTIAWWEAEAKKDTSILGTKNTCISDLRIKFPKAEHETIYKRIKSREKQREVAADYKITQQRVSQIVKRIEKEKQAEQKRQELNKIGGNLVTPEIRTGKFQKLGEGLPDNSIDLIFTDPNYGKEYIGNWGDLAKLAVRVLKPGRFLLAYSGQVFLREAMSALDETLEYYWMAGKYHDQGHQTIWSHKVWSQWKPILIYRKRGEDGEHEFFVDMLRMGTKEEAKELHDYGQSIEDAKYYIQKFSKEGEIVLDPCAGSGTILLAAKDTKRNAIGFEEDEISANIAKGRMNDQAIQ